MIALLLTFLPVLATAALPPRAISYLPDRLEICLRPAAAARARVQTGAFSGVKGPVGRLGVETVDRAVARFGAASFEPEFHGVTAPPEGSDEPDFTAFWVARWNGPVAIENAAAELRRLPEVLVADPIAVLPVSAFPNDSLFAVSSWFYDGAARADIHAPEAWDVTTGDSTIVVAILDTGVLPYHPDLGGTVAGYAGQIWTNPEEAAGTPGVDDDAGGAGNGFIDDLHGWDFVDRPPDGASPGEDYGTPDNDPSDYAGHGTAVAGVVGAIADNQIGVAGVAWNVRLMPLRVGLSMQADPLGLVYMSAVADAIRYATRMKATVINCSFETANQFSVGVAARAAIRAGVTIVVAAGNDPASSDYLMTVPNVIGVMGTGPGDVVVAGWNRKPEVDLAAPGVSIKTTFCASDVTTRTPTYTTLSGTSFSAPMVSGAAALLQAQQKRMGLSPLHPAGVLLRLAETADDISALNPGLNNYGSGRLNVARALTDRPTSTATAIGATTLGPAVRLPPNGSEERIAYLTGNRRLLVLRGQSSDTLALATLPATPFGSLAGAPLFGAGLELFVGTTNGRILGMYQTGVPLTGWPVDATGGLSRVTGCAIGDLEGDGPLEIIAASEDGWLHVYDRGGSIVAGFPVELDVAGTSSLPALADFDGDGGVEIALTTAGGLVHLIGADGAERPGWPQSVAMLPRSAVVSRLTIGGPPTIVVATQDSILGFLADGSRRFATALGGLAFSDPALGDLDGDGADEILLPLNTLDLAALDSTGVSKPGWPQPLLGFPTGEALVGSLLADTGSPTLEVLIHHTAGLQGFTSEGSLLPAFPKRVNAGVAATLLELDADGATEVLAGTGPDSILYVFDAGAGSASSLTPFGRMDWPTPRGNFARTASRDVTPPSPVQGLYAAAVTETSIVLRWPAPPNEGLDPKTIVFQVRGSENPIGETGFASAAIVGEFAAQPAAGVEQGLTVGGLANARTYHFVLRATDAAGNLSRLSNEIQAQTSLGGPLRGSSGPGVAAAPHPSPAPVSIYWRGEILGPGQSQRLEIFDLSGRRVRGFDLPSTPEGVVRWDGRSDEGATVRAGVYFVRLATGSHRVVARLVLVR